MLLQGPKIELVECKFIPTDLEQGKLYYSEEFNVAIHLCACGCGQRVVTPIDIGQWNIRINDPDGRKLVTLNPSIGNFQISCKTHYYIRDGFILWV